MSTLVISSITFVILAALFFVVSIFVTRFRLVVVVVNIFFLLFTWSAIASLVGIPKELDWRVPGYIHHWTKAEPILWGAMSDDNRLTILVDENGGARLYNLPLTKEMRKEINDALSANDNKWDGLQIGEDKKGEKKGLGQLMTYFSDARAHVMMKDPQGNLYIPKQEPVSEGVIENYQIH